ncbi:UDP-N-acetylmuramate--L-alanine ligase [Butyricicoccus sp. Marseille-Q5471]|uniref:UDP-N-acetylmuramate--L-alanine ligase n=1 Tax=Butyricicoccus sp. Marseille-Q5471 TaxID=3039493 RepID=UPI0024BCF884|nr:UDP-N-acetylmuramate--L-alanine ligase [Butyricicoccus sp. Marseille-Q5471]
MALSIQPYIDQKKTIHLIGIGGVSMNSLAELLLSMDVPVTGSDRSESPVTDRLERLGARITYAHLAENVDGAALIVRTAAVHDDNPEIIRARELGIPVMERAEAWGHLMRDYEHVVCLSGTHGKTTSTSMMTLITMEAALDPTVMVGSHLPAIDGTLRIGGKGCFVAESCEYCNSFLNFAPTVAVVLNVEADHLDFFKDINDIIHSFRSFCELTPMSGLVVVNADDANAMRCVDGINRAVKSFGLSETANVRAVDVEDVNGYYRFTVMIDGETYAKVKLSVPGRHNMLNALACCAASSFLGISGEVAARGLNKFTGSSRRFQLVGKMPCGATVVDDYAHHPSEMRATLSAAKEMHFDRILCAFQSHTYTRTKALFGDFVEALKMCDLAVLAPIYAAREQNTIGIYASDLAARVPGAVAFDSFDEIIDYIRREARPGDLVLTMGAGNINEIGPKLIEG